MSNLDSLFLFYDVVVLCKYKDKLLFVPCDDTQSGYYPNYDLAVPFETEHRFIFPRFVGSNGDESNIDGIMFIKTDEGIQIHCAENGWDGFQIITEERNFDTSLFL